MVGVAQHLVVDGVGADSCSYGDGGGVIPTVHRVFHSAFMANASRDQLLSLAVVLQAGDFRRSRKCGRFFGNLKGGRTVYDVVAAVLVADDDRRLTDVGVVAVGYAVLRTVNRICAIFDGNTGGFRRAVILVGVFLQRDGGGDFLRLDGYGHLTGLGIGVVGIALYHVIHGVGGRVRLLGNGLRIGAVRTSFGIHHGTAGGGAYVHQVLGLPGIGQVLGRRGLGQLRAGFLDGKLYLHVSKGIVAARLCGDGYSRVADIFVVGDVHTVIAVCQHRIIIVRRNCDVGFFLGAVVVVIVVAVGLLLQVVARQRDRHIYLSGRDIALGGGGVGDDILAVTVHFGRIGIVQRDRLAGSSIGVVISTRQTA